MFAFETYCGEPRLGGTQNKSTRLKEVVNILNAGCTYGWMSALIDPCCLYKKDPTAPLQLLCHFCNDCSELFTQNRQHVEPQPCRANHLAMRFFAAQWYFFENTCIDKNRRLAPLNGLRGIWFSSQIS